MDQDGETRAQRNPPDEPDDDDDEEEEKPFAYAAPVDEEDPVGEEAVGEEDEEERENGEEEEMPEARPSLLQYKEKWVALLAQHSKAIPGDFSRDNLVPSPDQRLWQDCPYVPFSLLKSDAAQARLSVCRPISGLEQQNVIGGVPTYAHNTGEVNYRRRAPLQLASTLGFILNQNSGKFLGLTPAEANAVHECLNWGRQGNNNRILQFFGTNFEAFTAACAKLKEKIESVVPQGNRRARIRASNRESRYPKECEIGETLGEEVSGMVVVDMGGHPLKYDCLTVLESIVAKQHCRVEIDVPREEGRGWRRTNSSFDTQELDDKCRDDLAVGARYLLEETWVKANDPHYDAKCWPCVHPYGSGSLRSQEGSSGIAAYVRNRLVLVQSWFRKSALWGFWSLDRQIKNDLYFKCLRRRKRAAPGQPEADPYKRWFGTAQPHEIPETTAWWHRQSKDLFALSDDAELGLMQTMVTITHNDNCPEMLAAVRRGPLAPPHDEEFIEYLLTRRKRDEQRPAVEHYSLEHVLSYQRRVKAVKAWFMDRNAKTPLGRLRDWWDRTEAQMRAALHAHILVWFKLRTDPENLVSDDGEAYTLLSSLPRTAPGTAPRQRPTEQHVPVIAKHEHDIYHRAEMGRVNAEMVRPHCGGAAWGGYDVEKMRIAGLARAIQSKLYLHACSPRYCLKGHVFKQLPPASIAFVTMWVIC